jgi:transposase
MHVYPARALERAMKAKEVITRALSGEINWMQAAEILGMTDRHLRRWRQKWEKYGYEDLFDRRMKRPSPKRVALAELEQVLRLYREKYFDLNVKHFVEKLHEQHHLGFSYTWVKTALQTAGLVQRYRKRGPHRKKRPRRPLPGMLLHVDGSRHRWIPGLDAYQDLIVVFDDATSEMYYAQLVEEESTETVMAGLKQVIADRGVFCALYSDRGSHFVYTPQAGKTPDRRVKTQIGRALEQIRIELIAANSPEARGRCERLFGTWQGRLPQEIRLRNISTVDEANAYLPEWIAAEHNRKFTITAREPGTAFVAYGGTELDKIWSNQQERVVSNDNTVTYGKLSLQISQQTFRFSLARCRVLVCRHLDTTISLHYGPHVLGYYDHLGQRLSIANPKTGRATDQPAFQSSSINDPGAKFPRTTRPEARNKEKRTKKERMGRPDEN